ncbi:MAG TPA: alanine--tRNA ligase [Candidatus Paceibacterota bacterium]|nr:alanine--tRNA ligase [Candidatus Paceibacterota bacterium]
MTSDEVRKRFLAFFEKRGHTGVPSSSLVPENDTSVLFTTAGMQQFKPYYTGEKKAQNDFGSKNTMSIQKCIRTSDIDEVGDATHLTFFEMLGNFSFGGYGRKEAIIYAHDFITKELGLDISYVTFYRGNENVPRDDESRKMWQELGVADIREDGADVFWGPTGDSGPCGPTTEIYCKNADGKDVEIWNIVFNEYMCNGSREMLDKGQAKLIKLFVPGIDTGMGFERLVATIQKKKSVYDTDLFTPILKKIDDLAVFQQTQDFVQGRRVIADHIRASVFMIADGVISSNTDRGYVLRRLIRMAIRYTDALVIKEGGLAEVADAVIEHYGNSYPELHTHAEKIKKEINDEEKKFKKSIKEGLPLIGKEDPFILYTSYGIPFEMTKSILYIQKKPLPDLEDFKLKMKKHQEISRAGAEQKFKGGMGDTSEISVRYHTATHLLHQALRDVLGKEVQQRGSNITPERLRFDFSFPRKMTDEEKKKVEDIVNEKIREALPMQKVVLPKAEAEKTGALHFFGDKYGDHVNVYFIGKTLDTAYSKEFCGGPHVTNTKELGTFKIQKEEAVSAGVRRIKAVLV